MKATFFCPQNLQFHVFAAQSAAGSCDAVGWLAMRHSCNFALFSVFQAAKRRPTIPFTPLFPA